MRPTGGWRPSASARGCWWVDWVHLRSDNGAQVTRHQARLARHLAPKRHEAAGQGLQVRRRVACGRRRQPRHVARTRHGACARVSITFTRTPLPAPLQATAPSRTTAATTSATRHFHFHFHFHLPLPLLFPLATATSTFNFTSTSTSTSTSTVTAMRPQV